MTSRTTRSLGPPSLLLLINCATAAPQPAPSRPVEPEAPASTVSAQEVFERASPGVVLVLASDDKQTGSGGGGIVVSHDGLVVTAAHTVLNRDVKPYDILFVFIRPPTLTGNNQQDLTRRFSADVVAWSPPKELDLALLRLINTPQDLRPLTPAEPQSVGTGDRVFAISHPESGGIWSLASGLISSRISSFNRVAGKDIWQTTATFGGSGSGAALINGEAELVGMLLNVPARRGDCPSSLRVRHRRASHQSFCGRPSMSRPVTRFEW